VKNVLIVDVANMYVGWYMEKYQEKVSLANQNRLINNYLTCMEEHYVRFLEKNDSESDVVNYIIKNHRYSRGNITLAPKISKTIWKKIHLFIEKFPRACITIGEDYGSIPGHVWKAPKNHYLRARDDFLCFKMSQVYKKKYINSVIMSDDKYRDYDQFGWVPDFCATYVRNISGHVVCSQKLIRPSQSPLGQIIDYPMVNITMEFEFGDPMFLKSSSYKIEQPGKVWGRNLE
jgi:hypothetical protein